MATRNCALAIRGTQLRPPGSLKEPGSGMKFPVCAVETRRLPVVVSPAGPLLEPEPTGAVMGTATQGNIVSDAATHSQSQVGVISVDLSVSALSPVLRRSLPNGAPKHGKSSFSARSHAAPAAIGSAPSSMRDNGCDGGSSLWASEERRRGQLRRMGSNVRCRSSVVSGEASIKTILRPPEDPPGRALVRGPWGNAWHDLCRQPRRARRPPPRVAVPSGRAVSSPPPCRAFALCYHHRRA